MTRICHFSDWHGSWFGRAPLPKADLYVCTGDMLPNDPFFVFKNKKTNEEKVCSWEDANKLPMSVWVPVARKIISDHEVQYQNNWLDNIIEQNEVRNVMFRNPDAPVICVRGNHDFVSFARAFGENTYEIHEPEYVIALFGLRFGGMRGINYIYGEWSDEYHKPDMEDRCRRLPLDVDVLCTHAPPNGRLDYAGDNYGAEGLSRYLQRSSVSLHLFGHIHEQGGKIETFEVGHPFSDEVREVKFSNAATNYNVIDV